MINPIRIGDMGFHMGNLCYWKEMSNGRLLLMFPGTPKEIGGDAAKEVLAYLKDHSSDLRMDRLDREPKLPPRPSSFSTQNTTLFLRDGERSDG